MAIEPFATEEDYKRWQAMRERTKATRSTKAYKDKPNEVIFVDFERKTIIGVVRETLGFVGRLLHLKD